VQALSADVPGVIARSAEDFGADLVVLAPHHRGRLQALLFPRVSDTLAHLLRIPLLLVPAAQNGSHEEATSFPRNGHKASPQSPSPLTQKDTLR
jgi:Universal stress protein family